MTQTVVEEDQPVDPPEQINIDWFLQSTVELINRTGLQMGITLTVGGAKIAGTLVSGKSYFEDISSAVNAVSKKPDDIPKALSDLWSSYTEFYEKPEDADDSWAPPPAGYIHLKDAYYFEPGVDRMPTNEGLTWRGQLSSVDGFSIGALQPG